MNKFEDSKSGALNQPEVDDLTKLLYPELRNLAAKFFGRERPGHTLQPTALVHEAYLRLIKQTQGICKNRTFFFAVAARVMRQVLIEHARKRKAKKRGGDRDKESLEEKTDPAMPIVDLLALDEALTKLEVLDERAAKVMELHHFGGLTAEEIAISLEVSPRTVAEDWKFAKAWLEKELKDGDNNEA